MVLGGVFALAAAVAGTVVAVAPAQAYDGGYIDFSPDSPFPVGSTVTATFVLDPGFGFHHCTIYPPGNYEDTGYGESYSTPTYQATFEIPTTVAGKGFVFCRLSPGIQITDDFDFVVTEATGVSAEMTTEAEIKLGPAVDDDEFKAEGAFVLGDGSDGIDPLTEDVTVELDGFTTTIPAGSFDDGFKFEDDRLTVVIEPVGEGEYKYEYKGENVDLSAVDPDEPVEVSLTVGDDTGTATDEEAEIKHE